MASPDPSLASASLEEDEEVTDIDELQRQIRELTKIRNAHQASLLSLRSTSTLKDLLSSAASKTVKTSVPDSSLELSDANLNDILLAQSAAITKEHQDWSQESLYRMAGLTKFSIQDPAPNGALLTGVRIEVMADGRFGTPYYLFLKPYDTTPKPTASDPYPELSTSDTHLTVHRHTVPSYFIQNLNSLSEKYLPPPPRLQNLDRLVKDMRHILVLHYLRKTKLAQVKDAVSQSLPETHKNPEEVPKIYISDFTVDPEARLAEVEWTDVEDKIPKRLGWIALTEEGGIDSVVVKKGRQRVIGMEVQIKGDWVRGDTNNMEWTEDLFERLRWTAS